MKTTVTAEDVSKRLEFVVMLAVFFPTILTALDTFVKADTSSTVLSWGIIIVIFICNYISFELLKHSLTHRVLRFLHQILLIEVAGFAFVLMSFGYIPNPESLLKLTSLKGFSLMLVVSYSSVVAIPFITLFTITLSGLYCRGRNHMRRVKASQ